MMGAINGDKNLQSDLNAYAKAKMNGDDTLFDKYVDETYDSSADNWLLFSYDDGRHVMMDDGKKDLKIVYMRTTENDKGEAFDTQVLEMKGSTSVAQSLYRIMGKERAEELMKDAPPSDKLILENPDHPDYEEKIGEYLMKTYDFQYLTSGYVDGYITANLNEDGTVDKFTVSATLLRMPESWDSELGYGIAVAPENNKARDILTFTKKDLNRNVIDTMTLLDVQSVDVYNSMDRINKEINRDQPYNAPFVDHEIQGNTIASNFSLSILDINKPETSHPMLIQNASTVAGYWIDKDGLYNKNSDGGGAWLLHWTGDGQTDGNRTSDGCIIPSIADVKRMKDTLKLWGMGTGDHIYGTLIDPRAGVNGHRLQQYQ
jgi:hypothetical protein